MTIIQRSPEWFEARRTRVTASEAAGLLGFSKYTSAAGARRAWIAKYRGAVKDFDNAHMARGRRLEPLIMEEIERLDGCLLMQDGGRPHDDWLWASADAWADGTAHGYEIKAPASLFEAEDREDYLLQMYIQAIVYRWDTVELVQGVEFGDGLELKRNPYTTDQLSRRFPDVLTKLHALHTEMVAEAQQEPEDTSINTEAWNEAEAAYVVAKESSDQAKAVLDEAKERLMVACEGKPARGSMLQVIEQTRQGTVDTKKLAKDAGLDLDAYRGEPTTFLTIRSI